MVKARAAWFLIALAGLVLFGWLSVQVYRSQIDPEGFRAGDGAYAWIVGPPPDALREAAERHAQLALERLNDRSLPPEQRLASYREELGKAEELLVRSLRAQPAQARVLAQLAAVRWELDPPLDDEGVQTHLEMIALASSMAPTSPGIQIQLGKLLLKMGRREEALAYLARTLDLNPRFTPEVVALMRDNLFTADEILLSLPPGPELLADLGRPFLEDGGAERYLEAVEALLADSPARCTAKLLRSHGSVCLALDQANRLRERMEEIGTLEPPESEAERWYQLARASLALGEPRRAIEEARSAAGIVPESAIRVEILGDVALQAGDAGLAIKAYGEALALAARGSLRPRSRARYYTKLGRAEEKLGRPDRAYDQYKRALRLNPGQEHARKRVEEMEAAAGL